MRITILQTDIKWAEPTKNRTIANDLLSKAPSSDIYVLPEMWTTGFITDEKLIKYAADDKDEAINWMKEQSRRKNGAISGSIIIRDENGLYRNRHYFVYPDGSYEYYDKRHLFTYGNENIYFNRGITRKIVKYNKFNILLATCYDLRFPVWLRNKDEQYDIILLVANWPQSRQNVWNILLKARAIENQCYVVGVNRTGKDPNCEYIGGSAIIDAKGNTLTNATTNNQQIITTEIDFECLETFRLKFPVNKDSDNFKLKI